MHAVIFLSAILAVCLAAPQNPADVNAQVVRYNSDNIGIDGYSFDFETSNGINQQEQGQLENVGTEDESIVVRGQYSFTGSDGVVYTVVYVADKNGFQPQGSHIPK